MLYKLGVLNNSDKVLKECANTMAATKDSSFLHSPTRPADVAGHNQKIKIVFGCTRMLQDETSQLWLKCIPEFETERQHQLVKFDFTANLMGTGN